MRNLAILIFIISFSFISFAQDPPTDVGEEKDSTKTAQVEKKDDEPKEEIGDEKEELEKAINQVTAQEKITALQKFLENFPESKQKNRVLEIIVSARAEVADEKLRFSENEEGVKLFKLAVEESPTPISDRLFFGLLAKFPTNLFWRGERTAAFEVAEMIEKKVEGNAKHLLSLATFYLGVENPKEAKRLAEKVLELEPELAAAYQTIGFANRLNFDLEKAEEAYQKAVELNSESIIFKNNLAEIKRALGKHDEALTLYREIIEKDEADLNAHTGIILSLFDSEKTEEAETELTKSLEKNPKNLILLVGVAYWYAAHKDGEKAIEFAKKALDIEPRYTWTYIALARGFMLQGEPHAAERTLLTARQFGNFPTLEYELAEARLAAGFYREAAEGLSKSFTIEDDVIKTKLGKRVKKEAENFIELLSPERRASIFQVNTANNPQNAEKLKQLLAFNQNLEKEEAEETEIELTADKFIKGDDKMKFHRQMFVADRLLKKKKALPKVLEITKDAVSGVDSALEVAKPSAAVMAEELYERRKIALTRGQSIIVPDIPKRTLSRIIRGRIEEMSGWALFEQEKNDEALIRLKLANSIYPQDSIWLRSSMWRYGTVLETQGKEKEALDAYIESYVGNTQDTTKKIVIETLYTKLNGSLDGLDKVLSDRAIKTNPTNEASNQPKEDEKTDSKEESVSSDIKDEKIPDGVPVARETPEPKNTSDDNSDLPKSDDKKEDNAEPKPTTEPAKNDDEKVEDKEKNTTKEKTDTDNTEESGGDSEESKPVTKEGDKSETKPQKCEISVSQSVISIGNNGGGLGVLVGLEEGKNFQKIKAVSSSPDDVEAVFDPTISKLSDRAFFFVKSISTNKGMYNVVFETPCGKKEITVKVR